MDMICLAYFDKYFFYTVFIHVPSFKDHNRDTRSVVKLDCSI